MSNLKDVTGQLFGSLKVIERAENTIQGQAQWKCICECGNEIVVRGSCLRNGHTKSCGCKQKEAIKLMGQKSHPSWNFKDLTGQRFGKLTVLGIHKKEDGKIFWECKCDCGNYCYPTTYKLKEQKSCGCILSYKEEEISQILASSKVKYKNQVTYDDLVSRKGRKLRFDFGIIKDNKIVGLIEYQGEQHTLNKPRGFYTEEKIEEIQFNDTLKQQYCKLNNIPLLLLDKNNILEKDILFWINNILEA